MQLSFEGLRVLLENPSEQPASSRLGGTSGGKCITICHMQKGSLYWITASKAMKFDTGLIEAMTNSEAFW